MAEIETFGELRDRVIEDGIVEVTATYDPGTAEREGAIDGFDLCRYLSTREEFEKIIAGRHRREHSMAMSAAFLARMEVEPKDSARYWRHRYATLQVEWVLSCLMVAGWWRGGDVLSGRAINKVAGLIGGEGVPE